MTVTNQGVPSMYSNGTTTRLRPPLNSDSSFRDTAHFELNQNQFDGSGVDATRYEQRTWDTPHENERLIGDASVVNDVINGMKNFTNRFTICAIIIIFPDLVLYGKIQVTE